jgi:hypothetical protein
MAVTATRNHIPPSIAPNNSAMIPLLQDPECVVISFVTITGGEKIFLDVGQLAGD